MSDATIEQVYEYICRYWKQFGYGPTLSEISQACYMSKPNLYRYLDRLESQKRISREPGKARSIKLLEDCPE